jgi:hypothetical protein
LTIDVAEALRRSKPEKRGGQLLPRDADALIAATDIAGRPAPLLIDTNVYVLDRKNARGGRAANRMVRYGALFLRPASSAVISLE